MRLAKQSARSDSKRDIDKKPARLVDVRRHTATFGNCDIVRGMRSWIAVVILSTSLIPLVASADARSDAREHYERGTTLFDLGKYIDAAHEYEAAFNIRSDPALLYNIGQAYRLGGDPASATRAYRSYLRRVPDASNRDEVERLLATLKSDAAAQPHPEAKPETTEAKPTNDKPQVAPTTPPVASTPQAPAAPSATLVASAPPRKPLYKRWWPWTIAGVIVVGAVTVAVVMTTPNNVSAPHGAVTINFP
jgi:tetratricopeptide (TPR) repeat protein